MKKKPWFAPKEDETLLGPNNTQPLQYQSCSSCQKSYPQVYVVGWVCLNAECVAHWKLPNGRNAPYDELDHNPAFLLHRSEWEDESEPFDLRVPPLEIGDFVGDNLRTVNIRGAICPKCGRCNSRYLFKGWVCDAQGCDWSLIPKHRAILPRNMARTPYDVPGTGAGLVRATTTPVVEVQVRFSYNYKILKYTFTGIDGCVIVAKANQSINAEPQGPDEMFLALQQDDVAEGMHLERRRFAGRRKKSVKTSDSVETQQAVDEEHDHADEAEMEDGARMSAFGMNAGANYKFITKADSYSFEASPWPVRACRSRLNWAQRALLNKPEAYQDFNEELTFAYMDGQKIKYHDDGEKGLSPTIATLSLGASASMSLRVKSKYFGGVSGVGLLVDEKPMPCDILLSSAETKDAKEYINKTYKGRVDAWQEIQGLKANGANGRLLSERSKALAKELGLKRRNCSPLLSFALTHGDIMLMHGEDIQKYLEHQVEPENLLRFAMTCRTILPEHTKPGEAPDLEVLSDDGHYDGSNIKRPGDGDAVHW